MSYGFFLQGDSGQTIIDDMTPVLAQVERGVIQVNGGWSLYRTHGLCNVTYATPRTTPYPPFVFGVPAGAGNGGIGFFAHVGGPGRWTGFRMTYVHTLDFVEAAGSSGWTGWEYRVCDYYLPPSNERFGLRVWDTQNRLVFDSGWPITPFRGLLRNWQLAKSVNTGRSHYIGYWGNREYNPNKDCDGVYQHYRHAWGAQDGSLGILISQLGAMTFYGDNGYNDNYETVTAPMIGFPGGDRSVITCGLALGILQHTGTSAPAMNNFALLTADFSRT